MIARRHATPGGESLRPVGRERHRRRRRGPSNAAESYVAILCSDQSYECSLATASVFVPIRTIFF
ncbi:hypothetical protein BVI1335_190042 [Burkholderia vietnamiensis]|nr:hypothetical protein BVI1335_190042 [Burkholderia vietnamiensis]